MNKIKEALALAGLEIDVEYISKLSGVRYKIGELGELYYLATTGEGWNDSDYFTLTDILNGELELKPVRFMPKSCEKLYYIDSTNRVNYRHVTNSTIDKYLIASGNCFRTEKEALENKDKVIEMFKKLKGIGDELFE